MVLWGSIWGAVLGLLWPGHDWETRVLVGAVLGFIAGQTLRKAVRTELGARFDKAIVVQGGIFTLSNRTAWAHDSNVDSSASATFQSLPGATFTTHGAQPSAHAALLSLGADMKWHSGWSVAALLDGEFSRTTTGYTGKGTLRYAW